MSALAVLAEAVKIIRTATELTELASSAIEAANSDDPEMAEKYLALARQHYADARKKWDEA